MAVVFVDGFLSVNGVDLSSEMIESSLPDEITMLDDTTHGQTTEVNLAGLEKWSLDVTLRQGFGAGGVDATLSALRRAAAFAVELRPVKTGGRSATNPGYNGNVVLKSYTPIAGKIGDKLIAKAVFASAGALSRSTA